MNESSRESSQGNPQNRSQVSPENLRGRVDQWRQQSMAERKDYEPHIREQIQARFQEYQPPLYASMVGYRRDWNLLVAQSRVSGFAATLGRDLDDEEIKALTEHTLENIHTYASSRWASLAAAGYMTYRGRNTFQFPFYKPKFNDKFNPNEANSLFSSKKVRGVYPRIIWHTMRFTAYGVVTALLLDPLLRALGTIQTQRDMIQDRRLERFNEDASNRINEVLGKGQVPPRKSTPEHPDDDGFATDYASQQQQNEHQNSLQKEREPYFNRNRRPFPQPQTREVSSQSSPKDDWDILDDDDASPTASSRASAASSASGGSSWDRLRQQSQPGTRQSGSETQGSWANVSRSSQQSQGGWGEQSQSQDSFSYSSEDRDKAVAKDQAQDEFDRLLDRERKGVDQANSWTRR